jgi:hypothetical protein
MKLKLKSIEPKFEYNEQRFVVTFETKLSQDQFKAMIGDLVNKEIEVR